MSSSNIEIMRNAYPEKNDTEAATLYAEKYGYIAIVAYKALIDSKDFTTIGCCNSEIENYLNNCDEASILYDGRSEYVIIHSDDLKKATCSLCKRQNDLSFCPNCGKYFCMFCYQNEIPLTEGSSGFGMCTTCEVEVQKALPGEGGKVKFKFLPVSDKIRKREETQVSDEDLDSIMKEYLKSRGE